MKFPWSRRNRRGRFFSQGAIFACCRRRDGGQLAVLDGNSWGPNRAVTNRAWVTSLKWICPAFLAHRCRNAALPKAVVLDGVRKVRGRRGFVGNPKPTGSRKTRGGRGGISSRSHVRAQKSDGGAGKIRGAGDPGERDSGASGAGFGKFLGRLKPKGPLGRPPNAPRAGAFGRHPCSRGGGRPAGDRRGGASHCATFQDVAFSRFFSRGGLNAERERPNRNFLPGIVLLKRRGSRSMFLALKAGEFSIAPPLLGGGAGKMGITSSFGPSTGGLGSSPPICDRGDGGNLNRRKP